jgi:hypothetical protein
MVIYFEPVGMCELQTDLIIAPLPAKKQLWEAPDEFVWRAEYDIEHRAQTDFGLAVNGELVKLNHDQIYRGDGMSLYKPLDPRAPSTSTNNWEEWCSGMDGFGGLIMLAASLVV